MKLFTASAERISEDFETNLLDTLTSSFSLVVWNDEVNTFEWVIETLVQVCGHTTEQAEQCAFIIHFNGKYAVKQGDYEMLKPLQEAIVDRGINATIEETVEH
jgi:ATP-dependent Clp protease adaptor protein ClpS